MLQAGVWRGRVGVPHSVSGTSHRPPVFHTAPCTLPSAPPAQNTGGGGAGDEDSEDEPGVMEGVEAQITDDQRDFAAFSARVGGWVRCCAAVGWRDGMAACWSTGGALASCEQLTRDPPTRCRSCHSLASPRSLIFPCRLQVSRRSACATALNRAHGPCGLAGSRRLGSRTSHPAPGVVPPDASSSR